MKRKPRKKRKPPHEKENVTQQLKKKWDIKIEE